MSHAPRPTLAAARSIILETLKQTSDALGKDVTRARGGLNQTLWHAQQALGLVPHYFSAAGQDMLLASHIFPQQRGGTFVDIGCGDGATASNSLYLEVFRQWSGLLVDAREAAVLAAKDCRRSTVVQAVIGAAGQEGEFVSASSSAGHAYGLAETLDKDWLASLCSQTDYSETREMVTTRSINDVLSEHQIGAIDFLAVNLAGGEVALVNDLDFAKYQIRAASIENARGDDALSQAMESKGYALVDYFGTAEVFVDADTQAKLVEMMKDV